MTDATANANTNPDYLNLKVKSQVLYYLITSFLNFYNISGWRGGFFQDQKVHTVPEINGCLLPKTNSNF